MVVTYRGHSVRLDEVHPLGMVLKPSHHHIRVARVSSFIERRQHEGVTVDEHLLDGCLCLLGRLPLPPEEFFATRLEVKGWLGTWMPSPRRVSLPIRGLTTHYHEVLAGKKAEYQFTLIDDVGGRIVVPAAFCGIEELNRITDQLQMMQTCADELHGKGVAEVPEGLHRVVGRAEQQELN